MCVLNPLRPYDYKYTTTTTAAAAMEKSSSRGEAEGGKHTLSTHCSVLAEREREFRESIQAERAIAAAAGTGVVVILLPGECLCCLPLSFSFSHFPGTTTSALSLYSFHLPRQVDVFCRSVWLRVQTTKKEKSSLSVSVCSVCRWLFASADALSSSLAWNCWRILLFQCCCGGKSELPERQMSVSECCL